MTSVASARDPGLATTTTASAAPPLTAVPAAQYHVDDSDPAGAATAIGAATG